MPQHCLRTSDALAIEEEWMAQAASVVGISQVVCGQEWMPVEVVEEAEAVDVVVPVREVEMVVGTASTIVFDGVFFVNWCF